MATGRRVAEACARQLIPCTLELGGKDPMIVCRDADLERAAAGAVYGAFSNAGQVCVSTERVYVVDEVADEFTRKVLEKTAALRQGPEGESDVGAMIDAAQLEVIEEHLADARRRGAKVLTGGRRNPSWPGLYFEPTVLTDVSHDMQIMREETFGPVLPIMRVRDENEALQLANDTRFGLNASVWTRDKRRGDRARQVDPLRLRGGQRLPDHLRHRRVALRWARRERHRAGQRRGRPQELLPRAVDRDRPLRSQAGVHLVPVHPAQGAMAPPHHALGVGVATRTPALVRRGVRRGE